MPLSEKASQRLADVRELEPTSNSELRDRWDMDSGKVVAAYLRDELGEYTYRDDDSRIRTVDESSGTPSEDESPVSSPSVPGSDNEVENGTSETETSTAGDTPSGGHEPSQNTIETEVSENPTDSESRSDGMNGMVPVEVVDEAVEAASETARSEGYETATEEVLAGSDSDTPEVGSGCTECGWIIVSGEDFTASLREQAQNDRQTAAFMNANAGAEPDRVCKNAGNCGLYWSNGDRKRFSKPDVGTGNGGGWLKRLGVGAIAAGTLGAAATLVRRQDNEEADGSDVF